MSTCAICGEPMPAGEEMFKYHGYSGPCPKPAPVAASPAVLAPVDVAAVPVVARLYTQNGYRRASVQPGPGVGLVLASDYERLAADLAAAREENRLISARECAAKQDRDYWKRMHDAQCEQTDVLRAALQESRNV